MADQFEDDPGSVGTPLKRGALTAKEKAFILDAAREFQAELWPGASVIEYLEQATRAEKGLREFIKQASGRKEIWRPATPAEWKASFETLPSPPVWFSQTDIDGRLLVRHLEPFLRTNVEATLAPTVQRVLTELRHKLRPAAGNRWRFGMEDQTNQNGKPLHAVGRLLGLLGDAPTKSPLKGVPTAAESFWIAPPDGLLERWARAFTMLKRHAERARHAELKVWLHLIRDCLEEMLAESQLPQELEEHPWLANGFRRHHADVERRKDPKNPNPWFRSSAIWLAELEAGRQNVDVAKAVLRARALRAAYNRYHMSERDRRRLQESFSHTRRGGLTRH